MTQGVEEDNNSDGKEYEYEGNEERGWEEPAQEEPFQQPPPFDMGSSSFWSKSHLIECCFTFFLAFN